MRDRPLRRRASIRARTTLAATGIVAVATVAIGWFLLGYLHGRLTEDLDAALRGQLTEAGRAVQVGSALPAPAGSVSVRMMPAPPASEEDLAEPSVPANPIPSQSARTPPARAVVPLNTDARLTATTTVSTPLGDRTLIASASTRSVEQATSAATTGLLLGAPVLLVLVAALTWFSTGRALRPVEAIRHEFTRLSAQDLRGRMPVPASGDEIARLATTLNDTLDRLDDSVRRQRRFVADASHELRSPLAALRTPLEVAQAHPDRAHWPTIAAGTLEDLDRLERLTSDLLALARIDGTTPTTGDTLDLSSLAADTITRRAPAELHRDVDVEPGIVIEGHRTHLARLITNLLDNAETHAEHRVAIRLRAEGASARLDVVDDGPGIPAEFRDQVFERFARLDTARTREQGGSGLGLALVREIADMHHGTVVINDSGRGAHFTVRVPLSAPSGSGNPDGKTPRP
ncbi:cell wall metabolism sensor histidine kinase WalK [Saccharopolyspora gloriosae]|uniref:sensor histidine kinase n=1 Tax=Saccharopolyspora gloriosae TaxID=455344 RepID=UPI001FB7635D|nr:ATP-binding protein [Saccharopolyspora gloriosae]